MERYRLKNIIILILVLLNVFLLAALAIRGTEERTARRTQLQELAALFAADGMELDPGLIPEDVPLAVYSLSRDEALERRAAELLLGGSTDRAAQGGGIYTYGGPRGGAVFRDSGSFDAAGDLGDAETLCRDFCRELSYSTPVFDLDEAGNGIVTTQSLWEKTPVANANVTFTVTEGTVTGATGTLLPSSGDLSAEQPQLLSAFAALTAFQQMRHESSFVVSSVTGISLSYELQNTSAAALSLVPAWRIDTDTATFYVNCASGTVRRA